MKQIACLPELINVKKTSIRRNQDCPSLLRYKVSEPAIRYNAKLCKIILFAFLVLFILPASLTVAAGKRMPEKSVFEPAKGGNFQVNQPPVAACKNITLFLGPAGTASLTGADVDGGSSDPDGTIVSRTVVPASFDCGDTGLNSVTLTVTDNGGLTSTCLATVTVLDRSAPTAICKDFTIYIDRTGSAILNASDINNGSTDNCPAGLRLYLSRTDFSCSDIGSPVPVTLIATDASGNSSSCSSLITVSDTVSPRINLKTFNLVLDASGTGTLDPADIDNGTYDNCGPVTLSVNPATFSCSDVGQQTVTMTAVDSYGNSSSENISITISSGVNIQSIALSSCDLTPTSALWSAEVEGGFGSYLYAWKGLEETSKPFMVIIPIPPSFQFSNTSTAVTPFFNNTMTNGLYHIRLIVTDGRGCNDTALVSIDKNGLIFNNISYRESESCQGATETYSVNYDPDATYSWNVVNGTIMSADSDTSRIVVRWNTGVLSGTVTGITNKPNLVGDPCGSSVVETVTLNNTPVPSFISPVTDVCSNTENTYTLSSSYPYYIWTVTGGNITAGGSADDNFVTVRWGNNPSGIVSVSVFNPAGCDASASENITISGVSGTVSGLTNISCNGLSDGSITVNASGGRPPYLYSVDGGSWQPGNIFAGLPLGNHIVTVRDDILCQFDIPFVINQPPILSGSVSSIIDVSCFGGNDGSVTISASGGTPSYQFSLNGGAYQTNNTFSGMAAGTYSVDIRDANGCVYSVPLIIGQPAAPLSYSVTVTDVGCFGASTGEINLTVSGGTAPYTFLWGNGATTEDISNLAAGNYSVTVTDAEGCLLSISVPVGQPAASLAAVPSVTDVSCFGAANGAVSITITGGTAPYTYLWNNGAITKDITGLIPGNYSVTVTDDNGCTATTGGTITQPAAPLTGNAIITNAKCFNSSDGGINLTVSGGTAPYLFSWSNGGITEDLSGLVAGTYTVTITDSNGCITTVTAIVSQPSAALAGAVVTTDVNCFGASTGSVSLTVTGGTSPYSFLWNNGAVTEDLTNVPAGTYSVVITDSNGCVANANGEVTEPATPVSGSISSQTNILCFGNDNGSFTIAGTGGVAPYQYQLGTGAFQPGGTFGSLSAGNYSATVRDANMCTFVIPVTITQPASELGLVMASTTDVLCFGETTGIITVAASGGTAPYEYSTGGGAFQSSPTFSNLAAGSHDITVRDNNLCTATISITVTQPSSALGGSIISQNNVACSGQSTADITVAGAGGTPPYLYSFNSGLFQSSGSFNDLAAGNYTVVIRDANNCEFTIPVSITQPVSPLSVMVSKSDNICFGGQAGSATAMPSGGTAPYTYLWNTVPAQTTATVNDLRAGTYFLTVTDSNGCSMSGNIVITEPATGISVSAAVTNVSCNGLNNGAIDLSVSDGIIPYSYSWSNGASSQDLSNLTAGSYTVTVTDANNCTATITSDVNQPEALTGNIEITNVACFGDSSGAIDLSVTGGTAPYTYSWSNGVTTEDLGLLSPGNYSVTITDMNSCAIIVNGTITQPASALGGSVTARSDVSVYGGDDGSVTMAGTGGSAPYMYRIGSGSYQASGTFSGLAAGSYTATVQDNNLCTFNIDFTLSQPLIPLTANITSLVNPLCQGTNSGTITIEGWGGTSPYEYSVNSGTFQSSGVFGSLGAATYTITVRDAMLAEFSIEVTINDPLPVTLTFETTDVLCFGGNTGTAKALPAGGTAPYTYSWNSVPVQTDATATALAAGTYTVTVTDANGCIVTGSVSVGQPGADLSIGITSLNALCYGGATGSASVTVTGGTPPYTYNWDTSPVQTTQTATGLASGTFNVTVTDQNGCTRNGTAQINEPEALSADVSSTSASCPDVPDGTVSLTITGGNGPYNVIWSDGNTSFSRTNILPGTYNAVITDQNGCAAPVEVDIEFTGTFSCVVIPHVITPNNDGYNDEWIIRNIDMFPDAEVRVFNRWGKLIFRTRNISANPWDGRYNGKLVPTDSYHYILYLNDGSEPKSGTISVIR